MATTHSVFIAGGTGYIGTRLIPLLLQRGHSVNALSRESAVKNLPSGCIPVIGNALSAETYADRVSPADTFVHLVGVAHPSPSKAEQFKRIDLESLRESVRAATEGGVGHFVFISVAHPAPTMHAYIEVRMECERIIAASGIPATILRPWYVLGPGHRWPYVLLPVYTLCEFIPSLKDSAQRLGLVTLQQMVQALVFAVEHPKAAGVMDVQAIRNARL